MCILLKFLLCNFITVLDPCFQSLRKSISSEGFFSINLHKIVDIENIKRLKTKQKTKVKWNLSCFIMMNIIIWKDATVIEKSLVLWAIIRSNLKKEKNKYQWGFSAPSLCKLQYKEVQVLPVLIKSSVKKGLQFPINLVNSRAIILFYENYWHKEKYITNLQSHNSLLWAPCITTILVGKWENYQKNERVELRWQVHRTTALARFLNVIMLQRRYLTRVWDNGTWLWFLIK